MQISTEEDTTMSYLTYFASDRPLQEQPNPYVKTYSINEALAANIEVDLELFESDIDKNKPDVILYCEDEENFECPNIYCIDKNDFYDDIGTSKPFCAVLEGGRLSIKYMDCIMQYMKDALKKTTEIELWSVWLGDEDTGKYPKKTFFSIRNLTSEHLLEYLEHDVHCKCMIITC